MARVSVWRSSPSIAVIPPAEVEGRDAAPNQVVVAIGATKITGSSETSEEPRRRVVAGSYGVVAVFAFVLFLLDAELRDPLVLGAGASAFALFYVAAQAAERLLEPFTPWILAKEPEKKAADTAKANAAKAVADDEAQTSADVAAAKAADLTRKTRERAILFWAITSVAGILASIWLGLYFLAAILAPAEGGAAPVPRWADAVVTGVVIGGGSKALHDLITKVQKPAASESEGD